MLSYSDLTTVPQWRRAPARFLAPRSRARFEVTAVDLDLDVIAFEAGTADPRGRYFIDDEDEFAEHSVRYGYPLSVVATVRADADALLAAVSAGEPPYDEATAKRWFAVLDGL
jgi:protein associated with RNAse G/E